MSLIEQIKQAKERRAFRKYIDYIRLPKYKNFIQGGVLKFDFPITVLVGRNGTGKSSILKALYGCQERYNIGDYWFSTKVDTILDSDGERNCFIYNYSANTSESEFEVLIQRAPRKGSPDYWETARPVLKYGMKKKPNDENYRKKKIDNECSYIDFHSILSAFDIFRYFVKSGSVNESNRYLRNKSSKLHKCLITGEVQTFKGFPQSGIPIDLTPEELNVISDILQKRYVSGKIINHKFFKLWGDSVILETSSLKYSEAFAGSGETAVSILIHKLHNMQPGTLVLLDEPEVCLHPGAQKKLFDYLKCICLQKQLQIVISSHSPEFLIDLPDNAIKIFNERNDGKIDIINECNSEIAFVAIGKDIENKKTIIVEDRLAKHIIEQVAQKLSLKDLINVIFYPGGESTIKKSIGFFSAMDERNKYVIFDGDQYPGEYSKISSFTVENAASKTYWTDHLKTILKVDKLDFIPKNSNESNETTIHRYRKYTEFIEQNSYYLPLNIPEEIIWNNTYAENITDDAEKFNEIQQISDYKQKFNKLASITKGEEANSDSTFDIQKLFVTRWLKNADENYGKVESMIKNICFPTS